MLETKVKQSEEKNSFDDLTCRLDTAKEKKNK